MIAIHYSTEGEDLRLEKGSRFRLKKSETLFLKTKEKTVLTRGSGSYGIHKLLELDIKVCFPEYVDLYLLPTEILIKKYKLTPTNQLQKVSGVPNQYTDNLGYGIVAFSETTLPKDLVAAKLKVCLSPDATLLQKLKWVFTKNITYIYDK